MRRLLHLFVLVLISQTAFAQDDNQPPKGFTALFNGKDIKDWTGGSTRDPREVAALPAGEREKLEADMQSGLKEHWKVENGELVSDGHEPYLATKRDYGDFEMWVDWKINAKGDSGIYLRGAPQVQIWDPSDEGAKKNGADKGSGTLWNNKKNERFPPEVADKPIGEWNRMYIRMVGPYVTVKLNDKLVVDNVVMENYYKPEIPIYATGPIYLQTHGSETRFRNVFVREIPTKEANKLLSEIAGDEKEFEPVFNGKDLSNWIGPVDDYEVKDGAIQCKPGRGGNLFTKDEFDNFVVRFEFKMPPGGNNGLALRAPSPKTSLPMPPRKFKSWTTTTPSMPTCTTTRSTAACTAWPRRLADICGPTANGIPRKSRSTATSLRSSSTALKSSTRMWRKSARSRSTARAHPGASRKGGHLALCGHNDPVAIRNIRVKRLPSK